MNSNFDGGVKGKLRDLYFTELQERLQTLEGIMARLQHEAGKQLPYEQLESEAHRLQVIGTTYGYPNITATAGALEEHLRSRGRDRRSVATILTPLIAAMNAALLDEVLDGYEPVEDRAQTQQTAGQGYRPLILVAEDNPAMVALLAELLPFAAIQSVAEGRAALAAMAARRFDLVILSNELRDMKGLDVLTVMAVHPQGRPPVIVVTADRDAAHLKRLNAAGAQDCVIKPLAGATHQFVERVQQVLARQKKTILIADDDPLVREILRKKLSERGVNVVLAANGIEALSLAREVRPQAIVLDRTLSKLDGLQVLREIRKEDEMRTTPVVILSTRNSSEDISIGYREGADAYIVKPFLPEQVIRTCENLITGEPREDRVAS